MREELEEFLETKSDTMNADDDVLQKKQLTDHFGAFYAQCTKNFRFLPGDRKYIHFIQNHIHGVVNKKGRRKGIKTFQ